MPKERYHGSTTKALAHNLFRPVGQAAREFWKRLVRGAKESAVDEWVLRAKMHADRDEWDSALDCARAAADLAEQGAEGDRWNAARALLGLGEVERGLKLNVPQSKAARSAGRDWNGETLSSQTLFVCQRTRSDMGAPIRLARFVAEAERRAGRVVVVVEPRLMPLFQRTFPNVTVEAMGPTGEPPSVLTGDYVTSFEAVAAASVSDWQSIKSHFLPLRVDAELVTHFREKYRSRSAAPIIGLTWGSRNSRKEVPELSAWARFIHAFPATFVSLQYGSVGPAVRKLRGREPGRLIVDETVDQLKDMDRFAAQVASLDAVVGISNTAIHLAGALGMPLIFVRDGKFNLIPLTGSDMGWYPSATMVRKGRRDWDATLGEVALRLDERLKLLGLR